MNMHTELDRGALNRTGYASKRTLQKHLRLQGLPEDFLAAAPFTIEGKIAAVGNGVPLAMGRAVAAAVRRALPAAPIEFEAPRGSAAAARNGVTSRCEHGLPRELCGPCAIQLEIK